MTSYYSGDTVASGRVVAGYQIRLWRREGRETYDWVTDTENLESGELFYTIAEAHADARMTLGGI